MALGLRKAKSYRKRLLPVKPGAIPDHLVLDVVEFRGGKAESGLGFAVVDFESVHVHEGHGWPKVFLVETESDIRELQIFHVAGEKAVGRHHANFARLG